MLQLAEELPPPLLFVWNLPPLNNLGNLWHEVRREIRTQSNIPHMVTAVAGRIYHTSPSTYECPDRALNFFTLTSDARDLILLWKAANGRNMHTVQHTLTRPVKLLLLHPGRTHRDLAKKYKIRYTRNEEDVTEERDHVLRRVSQLLPTIDGALLLRQDRSDVMNELVMFGQRGVACTRPHAYRLNVQHDGRS